MEDELKYHTILKQLKHNSVRNQNYELCSHIRDIETRFFVIDGKRYNNYIGFDKIEMIKSMQSIPKNIRGGLTFIRDFNLEELLG